MICEHCEGCELVNAYRFKPEEDKNKRFVLLLDSPSDDVAILGNVKDDKNIKIIENILKRYNLKVEDFYVTYAVKCSTRDSKIVDKASRKCKHILQDELSKLNNLQFIISFGRVPYSVLSHRKGTLAKNMNLPQEIKIGDRTVTVIPTVNPSYIYHDPETLNYINQAFTVFTDLFYDDGYRVAQPNIICIDNEIKFKEAVDDLSKADKVGFDVETTSNADERGLRIFDPSFRILTVGFATKNNAYWINVSHADGIPHKDWARQLLALCKHKIVAHNRTFDVLSSIRYFNLHDFQGDDTLVLAHLIDENQKKGLKHLASLYLGWHDYDIEVQNVVQNMKRISKPNYEDVPLPVLGKYNALDASATLHLYYNMYKKLSKQEKTLYNFLMHVQNMYIECSLNGIPVDLEYIANLKKDLQKRAEELYQNIINHEDIKKAKYIIKAIEDKLIDVDALMSRGEIITDVDLNSLDTSGVTVNLNSRYHLIAILKTIDVLPEEVTETGNIATSKAALTSLQVKKESHRELLDMILEYKKVVKLESTFIKGLLKQVYPDGKVHPLFSLTNTVTGRTASSNPNIQQIPRDKAIKNIFYAPEGYKIVQYDFSQAEIRVMASFANDENLLSAITSGADLHIAVASMMFDIPIDQLNKESPERQIAKSCSFGILYGTGPVNLAKMINSTKEEAAEKIDRFMKRFPKVQEWIHKVHLQLSNYGYVTTPLGRKRRLPSIWSTDNAVVSSAKRQAQNFPIQATASDLNLWLLLYVTNRMHKQFAHFLCSVHDSGVFMVHEMYLNRFLELLKEAEEAMNKTFTFLRCPVTIDIQVGQRWGELNDVEELEETEEELITN